jgi:hypothetical protein
MDDRLLSIVNCPSSIVHGHSFIFNRPPSIVYVPSFVMKLSIVLSTQPAQFQAATFKGDLETNLQRIAELGYDGVELAIRDPKLVDLDLLEELTK